MSAEKIPLGRIVQFALDLAGKKPDEFELDETQKATIMAGRRALEEISSINPLAEIQATWWAERLPFTCLDRLPEKDPNGRLTVAVLTGIRRDAKVLLSSWALAQAQEMDREADWRAFLCNHVYAAFMLMSTASATAVISFYIATRDQGHTGLIYLSAILALCALYTVLERACVATKEREYRMKSSALKKFAAGLFLK